MTRLFCTSIAGLRVHWAAVHDTAIARLTPSGVTYCAVLRFPLVSTLGSSPVGCPSQLCPLGGELEAGGTVEAINANSEVSAGSESGALYSQQGSTRWRDWARSNWKVSVPGGSAFSRSMLPGPQKRIFNVEKSMTARFLMSVLSPSRPGRAEC